MILPGKTKTYATQSDTGSLYRLDPPSRRPRSWCLHPAHTALTSQKTPIFKQHHWQNLEPCSRTNPSYPHYFSVMGPSRRLLQMFTQFLSRHSQYKFPYLHHTCYSANTHRSCLHSGRIACISSVELDLHTRISYVTDITISIHKTSFYKIRLNSVSVLDISYINDTSRFTNNFFTA